VIRLIAKLVAVASIFNVVRGLMAGSLIEVACGIGGLVGAGLIVRWSR
jgi:hypothetical protein